MYQQLIPLATDVRVSYAALNRVATTLLVVLVVAKLIYGHAEKKMEAAKQEKSEALARQALKARQLGTGLLVLFCGAVVTDMVTNPTIARITYPLVATLGNGGKTFEVAGNQVSVGFIALLVLAVFVVLLFAGYKKLSIVQFLALGLALYIVSLVVPALREVYRFLMSVYIWFLELLDSILGRPGAIAAIILSVVAVLFIDLVGGFVSRFATPITGRLAQIATVAAFIGAAYVFLQTPLVKSVADPMARAVLTIGQTQLVYDQTRMYVWFIVAVGLAVGLVMMLVKVKDWTVAGLFSLAFLIYATSFVWSPALTVLQGSEGFIYWTLGVLNSALTGVPS